ncbi:MAG TPA: hypothetical protein VGE59_02730 [Patescibacteria group bacterium]
MKVPETRSWAVREIERLEEEWTFACSDWGGMLELLEARGRGEITKLQYRYNGSCPFGHYVYRFKVTEAFTLRTLFNFTCDYFPDQWEERRKWHTWGQTSS